MQNAKNQSEQVLLEEIENLRQRLQQLVKEKEGQFLDPEVLRLSQEINELIVKYQSNKRPK